MLVIQCSVFSGL